MPYKDQETKNKYQREWLAAKRKISDPESRSALGWQARRDWLNDQKNKPCTDCGNTYPYCAMDFDHVSGTKVANVNTLLRQASIKRMIEEIAKCELVCANCHRVRTHNRQIAKIAWARDN